jgi:SPP1 gp7 family putative phage head morphogenesis protein
VSQTPGPRQFTGLADDYSQALAQLERDMVNNTLALLRRSLAGTLTTLKRSYNDYLSDLGPLTRDDAGQPTRRAGAYTTVESTAKFRAILHDAQQFMGEQEVLQWREMYERGLRAAAQLGGELETELVKLVSTGGIVDSFAGADPLAMRAAALNASAFIANESARFRNQMVEIVGEGVARGWGPSKLEKQIRESLRGARDPKGLTRSMGLEQRAALIARSELSNAYVKGSLERAKANGGAFVRVLASNDERVCPTCASRNGRVYPVDRVPIPWHPRCRCVAVPVPNEALEETDPAIQDVLLDSERWRAEHERGVEAYAKGKEISVKDARKELDRALRTPTASERRLYPKGTESLQESVALFRRGPA